MMDLFNINKNDEYLICLAGNPNTGKSSIFNELTKLKQHTGNWPGKTVSNARGRFSIGEDKFLIVDVPGTYSLYGLSTDEVVARDFICFGKSDLVIVVTDATALERNLSLVFQVMEYNKNVILVVNLIDEARRKGISVNKLVLEYKLGIPVVLTSAKTKEGLDELKKKIVKSVKEGFNYSPLQIEYDQEIEQKIALLEEKIKVETNKRTLAKRLLDCDSEYIKSQAQYTDAVLVAEFNRLYIDDKEESESIREHFITRNYQEAVAITKLAVKKEKDVNRRDRKIDNILTSKVFGLPIMMALLFVVLFITIKLANYPSELLSRLFNSLETYLYTLFTNIGIHNTIRDFLILGVYKTVAWVTAVMLPPMAIFFPLFTLLEDLGYLPRVAYNLDYHFKKASAHGKQCLSMCMGFGCNAAGVTGCRIIDSPREKLIAILTNTFVPCNGRFPTFIVIGTAFFAISSKKFVNAIIPTAIITGLICLGVVVTLLVSKLLSKTILKGEATSFTLELPPYRKPNVLRIIYTSLIDRTIFLLIRAIKVAAPFGGLIWLFANIDINGDSILTILSTFFAPFGNLLGLDGVIILAFLLALPANEILIPIIIMCYMSTGALTDFESVQQLQGLLIENGWTIITAINVLLFSLLHWPCSTTLLTIKKETGSLKYTALSFIIPTIIAITVCIITNLIYCLIV